MITINPLLLPHGLDELYALHDTLSDQLAAVDAAIWEVEEAGNDEPSGFRAMYYAIK